MKIKIYKKIYTLKLFFFKEIELECRGEGTREDPIIIDPTLDLPEEFDLRNNLFHINIINCRNHYITVNNSKNITIKDCDIDVLIIDKCDDIKIINNTISKSLRLYFCRNIIIEHSNIGKFAIHYSRSNIIKNCTIDRVVYKSSRNNTFEENMIPEKQFLKLNKSHLRKFIEKWGIDLTIIVMMAISIPIALILDIFFKMFPILTIVIVSILSISFIVIIIYHFLYYKKSKNEELKLKNNEEN